MAEKTLVQTWEEKGQEKKMWSPASSWSQKKQVGEILELYLCYFTLVDNLLSIANQQMNECLGIILLYQINENHGTFGIGTLKEFHVGPNLNWSELEGIHKIV